MADSSDSDSDDDQPLSTINKSKKSLPSSGESEDSSSSSDLPKVIKEKPELSLTKQSSENRKKNRRLPVDTSSESDNDEIATESKDSANGKGSEVVAIDEDDSDTSDSGVNDPFPVHRPSSDEKKRKSSSEGKSNGFTKVKKHRKVAHSTNDKESSKMASLKKYIRACGIHINNYVKLFEDCKSMKAKERKLSGILSDAGLEGRPTLEKCKMIRFKREEEKEIAELDMGNIISSGGTEKRLTRARRSTPSTKKVSRTIIEDCAFSNLVGVVDSDSSDDDHNERRKPKRPKIQSSSDEDSDKDANKHSLSENDGSESEMNLSLRMSPG